MGELAVAVDEADRALGAAIGTGLPLCRAFQPQHRNAHVADLGRIRPVLKRIFWPAGVRVPAFGLCAGRVRCLPGCDDCGSRGRNRGFPGVRLLGEANDERVIDQRTLLEIERRSEQRVRVVCTPVLRQAVKVRDGRSSAAQRARS